MKHLIPSLFLLANACLFAHAGITVGTDAATVKAIDEIAKLQKDKQLVYCDCEVIPMKSTKLKEEDEELVPIERKSVMGSTQAKLEERCLGTNNAGDFYVGFVKCEAL